MRTVWKFQLATREDGEVDRVRADVEVPLGTVPLTFGYQGGQLCMWGEVPNSTVMGIKRLTYWIVGTGWDIQKDIMYVATVFDGPFVWHIYRKP